MSRRGVSPVIATVLLVVLVIVIAGMVFVWSRNAIPDTIIKDGEPIERACARVSLEAAIFNNGTHRFLDINNRGNVDLYGVTVRFVGDGSLLNKKPIEKETRAGESSRSLLDSQNYSEIYTPARTLRIAPILTGTQEGVQVPFECEEPTFDVRS